MSYFITLLIALLMASTSIAILLLKRNRVLEQKLKRQYSAKSFKKTNSRPPSEYSIVKPKTASLFDVNYDPKIETYFQESITLEDVERIFNTIISNSRSVGFFAIDKQYKYILFNKNHKELLASLGIELKPGDDAKVIIDQLEATVIDSEAADFIRMNAQRMLLGEHFEYKEGIKVKDSKDVYQYVELLPMRNKNNEVVGGVVIVRDITTEQMVQKKLEALTQEEKNANKAKSNFLANMSHEIRTPMNGILGLTDLLLDTELNESQQNFLTMIRKSGLSLLNIINDILDFSKIESGNFSIVENDVNFYQLLDEVKEFFHFKSEEAKIEFTCTIDPSVPVWIKLDSLRIRQIMINLVGNAFKYTPDGYVKVIARVTKISETEEYLKVSVEDSGKGISYEKLSSIFDRFKQAENDYNRSHGGTGLGLSICKQLIDAMGGSIDVISKKDIGSIFFFEIPLKRGQRHNPNAFEKQLKVQFTKNIQILVAEDNQVNGLLIRSLMEKIGVSCTIARNGLEAVKLVSEQPFDLIFMDISMPIMDGLEAFRIIRGELHKNLPIIALTAHSMVEDRQRILAVGMTDYLSKPFSEADISNMIEKYVLFPSRMQYNGVENNNEQKMPVSLESALVDYVPLRDNISLDVFEKPLNTFSTTKNKNVEMLKNAEYNNHAYQMRGNYSSFQESLNGIMHVDTMLEGDHETTIELVSKLIILLNENSISSIQRDILAGDQKAVNDRVHHIKGAIANFKLKQLLEEFNKIKTLNWQQESDVVQQIVCINELIIVFVAAFEQFKSQLQISTCETEI